MRIDITSQLQLNLLEIAGKGWIVNQRDDHVYVHSARCSSIGAMTQKYPKTWFDNKMEATEWLDQKGIQWFNCGYCKGLEWPP